jgi:glycosyltransferase involved in cell wall biosynthesis
VEASYHGSALLHRLLSNYPPDRLTVVETAAESQRHRRLPYVDYVYYPIGKSRWLNTRFHRYAVEWFSRVAMQLTPKISRAVTGFDFEGVLTVAHGFGWLAAASMAEKRKVPLHFMVHDDWPRAADVTPHFRKWLDEQFARVYRQATSRLCVSPAMSRAYSKRYGEQAEVIYAARAADCPEFEEPPERLAGNDKPFTVAFAGTINSNGYLRALLALQAALTPVRGRLLVFGPSSADVPNAEFRGLLSWSDLMSRLRDEADALFVPMSFDERDRDNMEIAFPSKLADYTATGVPLLIYGPTYCSAVQWARENAGVAEVVETESDLADAVRRLATDPAHRIALGKRGLAVGRQYFTHDHVQQIFYRALST